MKYAVIPWDKRFENNKMFDASSQVNKNGLVESYAAMKEHFEKLGHEINTIDMYKDLTMVDFFLFFDWFPEWIYKLTKLGLESRMVYCNAEPATVRPMNSPKGYRKVLKYFPYVMTWNKDMVDNVRFFWRTIPYNFVYTECTKKFNDKKLLTSISANKKSDYKDELYTERERLITYFENAMPDQFDMYGVGWDDTEHPSYKGRVESKAETFSGYKFALALENTKNVKGYVTEKIFDCLTCGIVPVYYGADDITEYVSEGSFIDYRKFKDPRLLGEYLLSINESQYNEFVSEAKKCVNSPKLQSLFSGEMYAQNIIDMSEKAHMNHFKVDPINRMIVACVIGKHKLIMKAKAVVKK